MSKTPKTLAVAVLSLLLSGFILSSSASAGVGIDEECSGEAPQSRNRETNTAPSATADSADILAGDYASVDVLSNDTDPETDYLYVVSVSQPRHGYTCLNRDGTIEYSSNVGTKTGTDQFVYGITDGDFYRTATVTMHVEGLNILKPKLTTKLRTNKHGKVIRAARFSTTNTNTHTVEFLAGKFSQDRATIDRTIKPGRKANSYTRYRSLDFVVVVPKDNGDYVYVESGRLNTLTGKVTIDVDEFFRQSGARHSTVTPWHLG